MQEKIDQERIQMLKKTMKSENLIFLSKIPKASGDSDMAIEDLKKEVLDLIVEHSLYRDAELDLLFDEVVRKNYGILPREKVKQMVDQIKVILDD